MIIVSDATPLHYLILIGRVELLPTFFQDIALPQAVYDELFTEKTPAIIKQFMANPPAWLTVLPNSDLSDPELFEIDKGEREAILLAEKIMGNGILIDDLAGRETRYICARHVRLVGNSGSE